MQHMAETHIMPDHAIKQKADTGLIPFYPYPLTKHPPIPPNIKNARKHEDNRWFRLGH